MTDSNRAELRQIAKEAQALTFDTGRPCKRGHYAPRYTSNSGCVECLTGKSAKPLSAGQLQEMKPYHFQNVVPNRYTTQTIDRLELYLIRCLYQFAIAQGVEHPPYHLAAVTWAEQLGRPLRECPI